MFNFIDTALPTSAKTAAGDVNGDGKADFVVLSSDGTTLTVLLGNGDGTTATGPTLSPAGGITATALGDVNGDGKLDLAIANSSGTGVAVALGNGDGTFQALGPSVAAGAAALALGDLNGDGRADLVTLSSGGIGVVRLSNADGSFGSPVSTFSVRATGALAIGDVTGDGKADIVTAGTTPAGAVGLVVIAGRGDGGLGASQYLGAGYNVNDIALSDLNADGRLDIAAASYSKYGGSVSVFVNDGNGAYLSTGTAYGSTPLGPTEVEVADVDGNGRPDIVFPVRSAALLNIPSVNSPGTLSLSADVQLNASVADADNDARTSSDVAYAWQRSDGFGGYTTIAGATAYRYEVSAADDGHDLRAVARYADGSLTIENVTSSKIHVVAGSAAGQTLVATGADDFIFALGDVSSADFSQHNTAVFATSVRLENTVTQTTSATETVVGPGGHDSLVHVGNFAFLDGILSFDANGSAGVVTRLYDAALGRDPDSAGLSHFTTALEHGATLRDVAAALTASSEYQAHEGGLANGGFVGAVYEGVLHRNASAGEMSFWSGQLDQGTTRADVIVAIAQSSEAVGFTRAALPSGGLFVLDEHAAQVARLYDTAFGRDPDRAGLEYWRGFLDQGGPGHTLGDVANAFAGSFEFRERYAQATNDDYVSALYYNTLDRAPDAAGRAHWDAILDGAAETRAQIALDFSESPEHQALLASHIRDGIHLY